MTGPAGHTCHPEAAKTTKDPPNKTGAAPCTPEDRPIFTFGTNLGYFFGQDREPSPVLCIYTRSPPILQYCKTDIIRSKRISSVPLLCSKTERARHFPTEAPGVSIFLPDHTPQIRAEAGPFRQSVLDSLTAYGTPAPCSRRCRHIQKCPSTTHRPDGYTAQPGWRCGHRSPR